MSARSSVSDSMDQTQANARSSLLRVRCLRALAVTMALVLMGLLHQRHAVACVAATVAGFDEIAPGILVDPSLTQAERVTISNELAAARARVATLLGELRGQPHLIFAATQEAAGWYAVAANAPAGATTLPWGTYLGFAPGGVNVDVISHELVHAELADRIGYWRYTVDLPVWFNEGVAMQVDHRQEKIWRLVQSGALLPAVDGIATGRQFFRGDIAAHYAAAQVEVAGWLAADERNDLAEFIADFSGGASFSELYVRASAKASGVK